MAGHSALLTLGTSADPAAEVCTVGVVSLTVAAHKAVAAHVNQSCSPFSSPKRTTGHSKV